MVGVIMIMVEPGGKWIFLLVFAGVKKKRKKKKRENENGSGCGIDESGLLTIANRSTKRMQADGKVTVLEECVQGGDVKKGEICGRQGSSGDIYANKVVTVDG